MVDHVGPFYAGDMHDFFVGLMGKRNLQPGRSMVGGLGCWQRCSRSQLPYVCQCGERQDFP